MADPIPPDTLAGHMHPERVRDYHRGGLYAWRVVPRRTPAEGRR